VRVHRRTLRHAPVGRALCRRHPWGGRRVASSEPWRRSHPWSRWRATSTLCSSRKGV